jgi:hypothetical protein
LVHATRTHAGVFHVLSLTDGGGAIRSVTVVMLPLPRVETAVQQHYCMYAVKVDALAHAVDS